MPSYIIPAAKNNNNDNDDGLILSVLKELIYAV